MMMMIDDMIDAHLPPRVVSGPVSWRISADRQSSSRSSLHPSHSGTTRGLTERSRISPDSAEHVTHIHTKVIV